MWIMRPRHWLCVRSKQECVSADIACSCASCMLTTYDLLPLLIEHHAACWASMTYALLLRAGLLCEAMGNSLCVFIPLVPDAYCHA